MIKIKSFSGDYQKVYELIKKSWQDDYVNTYRQPVQDFTPEFLRWNIEREGYDPDLILEGYIKNNLVGFSANMPRKLIYDGKIIKAVLTTFISVHPQTKNKGIGKRLLDEQIFRIKEKKYGLNYFINDEGHISEKMFANLSLRIGTPVLNYHRFTFLTKPLDAGKIKKIEKLSFPENAVLPFISPVKKKNTHKSTPPPPKLLVA
jgi:GNAT superfamily N-acetyltransferase